MYNHLNNKTSGDETSMCGSRLKSSDFSSTPISGGYGSTQEQDQSVRGFCVPCCALVFYVMAFFGYFCSFVLRQSLNVAIVAMVNQTAVTEDITVTNTSEKQCPRDPELRYEDGEFNWDRHQQGTVLAAFFYGHEFTQVHAH